MYKNKINCHREKRYLTRINVSTDLSRNGFPGVRDYFVGSSGDGRGHIDACY